MSLHDVGSFGQPGEVEEGPAHPQTDEEELWDELWAKKTKSCQRWIEYRSTDPLLFFHHIAPLAFALMRIRTAIDTGENLLLSLF